MSGQVGRKFRGIDATVRRAQRRQRLLDAGLSTFGSQGFHGSGVRSICAAAGLTERYFYESFENREALFAAVFDDCVARIRAGMEQAIADSAQLGPLDVARVTMRQYLETLRSAPGMVRVLFIDSTGIDAEMGQRSARAARSFTDLLVPALREAHPGLAEAQLDAQSVADGLVGSTVFIVTQWALSDFDRPVEQVLDACMLFYTATHNALSSDALS